MGHDLLKVLRTAPIFENLSVEELEPIARMCRSRRLEKGEFLFMEGATSHGFFLLLRGRIKIFKISATGKEHVLHLMEPGQTFAEAAMFSGKAYPANASAVVPSEVALIPNAEFESLLLSRPRLCLRMMASLATWLHRMVDIIDSLAFSDVEARVVSYLLRLCKILEQGGSEGLEIELEVEKSLLATYLGTTPETFSRVLRRLQDKGWIKVKGSRITINDYDSLSRLLDPG